MGPLSSVLSQQPTPNELPARTPRGSLEDPGSPGTPWIQPWILADGCATQRATFHPLARCQLPPLIPYPSPGPCLYVAELEIMKYD